MRSSKIHILNDGVTNQTTVSVYISPGEITPAMKTAWKAWWRRLIVSAREEIDNQGKIKRA